MSLEVRVASVEDTLAILAGRIRHLETLEPAGGGLKELWADVRPFNGSTWMAGMIFLSAGPPEAAVFDFVLPEDWKSIREAFIYVMTNGLTTDWAVHVGGTACGHDYQDWSDIIGEASVSFDPWKLYCLDVTAAFTPAGDGGNPGDWIEVAFYLDNVVPNTPEMYVIGLLYRYN